MKIKPTTIIFMLVSSMALGGLAGCTDSQQTSAGGSSTADNTDNADSSNNVEQLKKEVLDMTCDDQMRKTYESKIQDQTDLLNPQQLRKACKYETRY